MRTSQGIRQACHSSRRDSAVDCGGSAMRTPEWIQLAVVSVLVIAAFLRRLERDRQLTIALLALLAIVAISAARFSESFLSPYQASILWDWMPGIVMLIPYWQVGQFFTVPDHATEARLASFDHDFYRRLGFDPAKARIRTVMNSYLELAYFGCTRSSLSAS